MDLLLPKPSVGWTVFIVECADGSFFGGMCENFRKRLYEINNHRINYFINNDERLPVRIVHKETHLPFREAFAKAQYMKEMNRKLKKKLIETGVWPVGGPWKEYVRKNFERDANLNS